MKFRNILLVTFLFINILAQAQNRYKVDKEQSQLSITGTSTLHDWEIEVNEYHGYIDILESKKGLEINGGKLSIEVESFKSGKGGMDKKVYEAMEYEDHPLIYFEYKNTIKQTTEDRDLNMIINGDLTIAGVTRNIEVEINGTFSSEKTLQFEGVKGFKMTTFNIEPPSAMFGTIKSGDKITVDYSIIFQH